MSEVGQCKFTQHLPEIISQTRYFLNFINTVALARWKVRDDSMNRFNGFRALPKPLKRLKIFADFVHRAKATVLMKLWIKRIVLFLFSNGCERAVSGTKNRFVGQRKNILAISAQRFFVRNGAATHRTAEDRVTDNCDWFLQTGNHKSNSASGMAAGLARFDFQTAERKTFPGFESFGVWNWFKFANVNWRGGFFFQRGEIHNVIDVNVREEDQFYFQRVFFGELEHRAGARAGVERNGASRLRIENEIGIDGHVFERRVERSESDNFVVRRIPGFFSKFHERVRREI